MKKLILCTVFASFFMVIPAHADETSPVIGEDLLVEAELPQTQTYTTTANVNVRVSPDIQAEKLGILIDGTKIEVISQENQWSLVQMEGRTAYVSSLYLSSDYEEATTAYLSMQPVNRWNITLSQEEQDVLARIVMLEAGGEPVAGQQAVAEVILNRMVSPVFPDTLTGVLSQSGQFSTWRNRYSTAPTDTVRESVRSVLHGESNLLPMNTLYFSRNGENGKVQAKIGRHIFCNQ